MRDTAKFTVKLTVYKGKSISESQRHIHSPKIVWYGLGRPDMGVLTATLTLTFRVSLLPDVIYGGHDREFGAASHEWRCAKALPQSTFRIGCQLWS